MTETNRMSPLRPIPAGNVLHGTKHGITTDEIGLMHRAMGIYGSYRHEEDPEHDRAWEQVKGEWRALTAGSLRPQAEASGWASPSWWLATRFVDAYEQAYPKAEENGAIDSWGGCESRSLVASLAEDFSTPETRMDYTQAAAELVWRMGYEAAREAYGHGSGIAD